jgi:ABC-type transport system involved in multi-copper enzyme maturation permease subunit
MQRGLILNFFTLAGLYSVNFLTVMSAVLLPVDTLSGEIASGVLQTVASKPIARRDIVLGKWLAYVLVVGAYLLLLAGGVLLEVRLVSGFQLPGVAKGLPLMFLESIVLVTLSIAGGSRLSTVTSGVVAFGLYGLAFIGSWVEQVGGFTGNVAARDVGTVASLIMPSESLWQLAAHHMQPPLMSQLNLTPFSPVSVPSIAMVYWAMGYIVVLLLVALRSFDKRPL